MITVKTLKNLRKLTKNNKKGELALVEETKHIYEWDGANWVLYNKPSYSTTLYQINQSAIGSLPAYTDEQISQAKDKIKTYVKDTNNHYYMLLNNEKHYYTVLEVGVNPKYQSVEDEVISCLRELGTIKSIVKDEDNNVIECWTTADEEHTYVYYLFPYDKGVIKCK